MEFNPDAYLAEKTGPVSSGFDPDAYLAEKTPTTSALGAAGRGAIDAVPFGTKAAAAIQPGDYQHNLGEMDSMLAADKEQHPVAHYGGETVGTVAPFLIPGVGEALGAESVLGRAAVGAGLGGLQAASSNRDPDNELSDIAKGAAIGGIAAPLLGAAGDAVGGLFRGAAKTVNNAVVDAGDTTIPQVIKPSGGPLFGKGAPEVDNTPIPFGVKDTPRPVSSYASADDIHAAPSSVPPSTPSGKPPTVADEPLGVQAKQGFFPSKDELKAEILSGALGGSPRQLRNLPGNDLVATINKMGEVIQKNSTAENQLIAPTDRYSDRLQKFIHWQNQKGAIIGDTIKQSGLGPMNIQPISDAVQSSARFAAPDDAAQLKTVVDTLGKYAAMDGDPSAITFERLQQFKTDLGHEAYNGKGNQTLQAAYHAVSDLQDQALEHAAGSINLPAFRDAKEAYQVASRAIPMLRMATSRSLAKGYSSYGTPLAALVTGHPVAAIGALLHEPLSRAANAVAFGASQGSALSGAAEKAESVAPSVLNGLLNHPAMQPFQHHFQSAIQGITDSAEREKAAAVTDYTLSQSNPAYAKAKAVAQGAIK